MFKKISLAISVAVVAISSTFAADNAALDIFTGKEMTVAQEKASRQAIVKSQNFETLYAKDVPMAPLADHSVTGPTGTITIYADASGQSQIKGTYNGAQFNSVGPSQIPFNGKNVGSQNGSKFIQFFSPKATIIVANNYPAASLKPAEKAALETMAPGCIQNGVVLTAVVLAKPSGMETVAGFNTVVPLN